MQRSVLMLLLCMLSVFSIYPHAGRAAEDANKVAILNFQAETPGKYGNIRDALSLMLSGRLASREGITVVGSSLTVDEEDAVRGSGSKDIDAIFEKLDVDYIGTGEISEEGSGLRLKMTFQAQDGRAPIDVSALAADQNQILAAVDTLADEIARKVFGLSTAEENISQVQVVDQSGVDAFRTEHPDKKYKKEVVSGVAISADGDGASILQGDMLRRRASLKNGVLSLSVADIDADGVEEIAVVSERDLRIFHYDRGLLEMIGEISFDNTIKVHAMNIADVDGDGMEEMYISAVDDDRFASLVLTWTQAQGFQVLAEDIRWAIRPLAIPGEGYRLIGQDRSVKVIQFFEPGLYYIDIDYATGDIVRGERLFVPKGVNLFDFIFADIDGDALHERVAITRNMKLVVYDHQNRLVWASTEDYGGRNIYLGDRWLESDSAIYGQEVSKSGEALFELQYIPVRLIAKDMDGDGGDEILAASNSLSIFRGLTNLRSFSDGHVVCLRWNGAAMQELWATDTLGGHIAAFDVTSSIASRAIGNVLKATGDEPAVNKVSLYVGQVPANGLGGILNVFADKGNLVVYNFGIAWETGNLLEVRQ